MSLIRACKVLGVLLVVGGLSFVSGADWNQWRGPNRDGVAPESPPLSQEWPRQGPPEVWTSAEIPSERKGGFACVSTADGRAYAYSNWKYHVPTPTRTLNADGLRRLGWRDDMPEDIREATEKARLSEERQGLEQNEVRGWAAEWVKENISEENSKWRGDCQRRLLLGERAVPLEKLKQLADIVDKEFPTQDALDAWFAEHGIEGDVRSEIMKVIPDYKVRAKDVVFCFDAKTGETLWEKETPGTVHDWASSSTPCVAGGRVYLLASDATAVCLDAQTGSEVWKAETDAPRGGQPSASFAVVDSVAVLSAGPLTGYDATSGDLLWQQKDVTGRHNSPTTWKTEGGTLLICQTPQEVACVDPADGRVLWQVKAGGSQSSATVEGDRMVVMGQKEDWGVRCYRVTREGAEELWTASFGDRGASPSIYGGAVYIMAEKPRPTVACLDMQTGEVNWEKRVRRTQFSSPVVADGKLIVAANDTLMLFAADPEECRLLGEARLGIAQCTSPALADGRVYLRLKKGIGCFDLRPSAPKVAEEDTQ